MPLRRGLLRDYAGALDIAIRIIDIGIIVCSGWASLAMQPTQPQVAHFFPLIAIALAALLAAIIFPLFGIYRSWRGARLLHLFSRLTSAWLVVVGLLVGFIFIADMSAYYPRAWLTTWVGTSLAALLIQRYLLFSLLRLMRKHGLNHRRVIILGAGDLGREILRRLRKEVWSGYDVVAFYDDDKEKHGLLLDQVPVVGSLDAATERVTTGDTDEVWIALPLRAEARVREVLHLLRHSTVNIRFVPDIYGFRLLNHSISEVVGMPMLNLSDSPMSGINRLIKSLEDYILASLILVLVSPLMLLIALGVRLSGPGPIIFKQLRHGWDGREIKVYKFRTMIPHSEPDGQVTQARPGDPRLTPFGALLRHTSLDELPQFINVLQGRMSIVGPRPHALAHNEFYKEHIDSYMLRHKVKPGITGWAQVNGLRGETDTIEKMKKRLEYDLYYIEHWSFWFDLKIIVMTILKGFVHKNAY